MKLYGWNFLGPIEEKLLVNTSSMGPHIKPQYRIFLSPSKLVNRLEQHSRLVLIEFRIRGHNGYNANKEHITTRGVSNPVNE